MTPKTNVTFVPDADAVASGIVMFPLAAEEKICAGATSSVGTNAGLLRGHLLMRKMRSQARKCFNEPAAFFC